MKGLSDIWREWRAGEPSVRGGNLVLVVGPSGAGKDTLIALARQECRDDPAVVFPRRVVTRLASAHEDHDTLPEQQFVAALREGRFALSWEAHGLRYGIPASITGDLTENRAVVCNVSRTVVTEARGRYPRTTVVLVTAPAEILAARLAARGRASDGSAAARLDRSRLDAAFLPDVVIENTGAPEAGVTKLLDAIRQRRVQREFQAGMMF